ncbi:actin depolymerizing factor [Agrocybe pediades]|nr:actin depolymerizing factor [Agrocybe pediades]
MASSGIQLNSSCQVTYQDLKLRKKYKYIVFNMNKDAEHIKDATEIVVEKTSTETDYEKFIADFPEDSCRFAIYDFEFEKEGAGKRNKIIFLAWSPDNAPTKQKMVFASSKETLKRELSGIAAEIQGTDYDEIAHESVMDKVKRVA